MGGSGGGLGEREDLFFFFFSDFLFSFPPFLFFSCFFSCRLVVSCTTRYAQAIGRVHEQVISSQ